MEAVDGNAIGGLLHEVFGTEMTDAASVCGSCGAARPVAELEVYLHAPGTVVRCRSCDSVLMVFVTIQDTDLRGPAGPRRPRLAGLPCRAGGGERRYSSDL